MSSLVGYVTATYDQLVEAFGEPTYPDWSADYKVSTEWDLMLDLVEVRIYDWKEMTKEACRSGKAYEWHIGGRDSSAVAAVRAALKL